MKKKRDFRLIGNPFSFYPKNISSSNSSRNVQTFRYLHKRQICGQYRLIHFIIQNCKLLINSSPYRTIANNSVSPPQLHYQSRKLYPFCSGLLSFFRCLITVLLLFFCDWVYVKNLLYKSSLRDYPVKA